MNTNVSVYHCKARSMLEARMHHGTLCSSHEMYFAKQEWALTAPNRLRGEPKRRGSARTRERVVGYGRERQETTEKAAEKAECEKSGDNAERERAQDSTSEQETERESEEKSGRKETRAWPE
eukprot:891092-Pleurochrysis_carterae.AAC.1